MGVKENLKNIKLRIEKAKAARKNIIDTGDVKIIAASKYVNAEAVVAASRCGVEYFGENKVQALKEKIEYIREHAPDVLEKSEFYMIGHLQSNKSRDAVGYSGMIQSVDSKKIAHSVNAAAVKQNKIIPVLIELKTSTEETKSGIDIAGAFELAEYITAELKNLKFCGVMTMAEFTEDTERVRGCFKLAYDTFVKFRDIYGAQCEFLSMGMSDDFEIAVSEGANMVRIGRLLFKE